MVKHIKKSINWVLVVYSSRWHSTTGQVMRVVASAVPIRRFRVIAGSVKKVRSIAGPVAQVGSTTGWSKYGAPLLGGLFFSLQYLNSCSRSNCRAHPEGC